MWKLATTLSPTTVIKAEPYRARLSWETHIEMDGQLLEVIQKGIPLSMWVWAWFPLGPKWTTSQSFREREEHAWWEWVALYSPSLGGVHTSCVGGQRESRPETECLRQTLEVADRVLPGGCCWIRPAVGGRGNGSFEWCWGQRTVDKH